jgi:hypothetical protein
MLEHDDGRRWKIQFDSLWELTDWLSKTPERWTCRGSRTEVSHSWTLGVDYDKALKLASEGWEEGVREITALAATVPNAMTYEQRYGVAGDRPDVPRYLAGDPFNMVHRGKVQKPKPAMTIVASYGANCSVRAQDMWNFGAALTALVDRLESRHVRVELIAVWRTTGLRDGSEANIAHTVKRAEDALDISAVAFSLAHPAMLRRLGFAVLERSDRKRETSGYGRSESKITAQNLIDPPAGALYIGGVGSTKQCGTLAGALAYAKRMINDAAGEEIAELEELS